MNTAITDSTNSLLRLAVRLEAIGTGLLRYGLVFILFFYGGEKWTAAEAAAIQPMVAHSPVLSWIYALASVQVGSELIGVVELLIGVLLLLRRWFPLASAAGSLGGIAMFLVTLSFLFTTPGLDEGSQAFLLKDIFLLGASVLTAGETLRVGAARQGSKLSPVATP